MGAYHLYIHDAAPGFVHPLSRLSQLIVFSLSVGAAVRLTGSWVSSPGRGQTHELRVQEVQVVGPSDAKVRSGSLIRSGSLSLLYISVGCQWLTYPAGL